MSAPAEQRRPRRAILVCGLLTAAIGLRVIAARGDLWLDELWSLSFARQLDSPLQIWTSIHHDNNHPLNTLYLFVVVHLAGAHASSLLFRLLSLIAGAATLPLIFLAGHDATDERSTERAWTATVLCACSFLAILYSSEARGYAPAAFFAVAAYLLVRRRWIHSSRERLLFAAACGCGLFSHLTFLFVYAGLVAWTGRTAMVDARFGWRGWIVLHRLPMAIVLAEYFVDARHLVYGGGPAFRTVEVLGRGLSLAVGGPDAGLWEVVAATYAASLIAAGLLMLLYNTDEEAAFFVTALLLAPAGILLFYRARFLEVRYFFVLLPFVWILAGRTLERVAAFGSTARLAARALLALSIAGNAIHLSTTLRLGRGHYSEAIATMAALSSNRDIVVGSDQDFSNGLILAYYAEAAASERKLVYVSSTDGRQAPDWFITHTFDVPAAAAPSQLTGRTGDMYWRVRSFAYGGLSGCNWFLYRRR
jgi:hypothetical protein